MQIGFTDRHSTRLPTLDVPVGGGQLIIRGDGVANYREVQISARKKWDNDQQLFVSYVRSASTGELNDFATVFGGSTRRWFSPAASRASRPMRRTALLAWGTFNLPRRIVVSPVLDWHDGFPVLGGRQPVLLCGRAERRAFPDLHVARSHRLQDVFGKGPKRRHRVPAVQRRRTTRTRATSTRSSTTRAAVTFTNSVGPILRGYIL